MTQNQALEILKTGANVFLTGEPGSGKTHTVNTYVAWLRDHKIETSITASTGIAATHIGGMTIHSFSGIGVADSLSDWEIDAIASVERISSRILDTRVLIIDEVSMLASHTLELVDRVFREVRQNNMPFGGVQVVLVGDFFQLPPVAREGRTVSYGFKSNVWQKLNPIVCYLTDQYRQDDLEFLEILSAVRSNEFLDKHHELIATRRIQISAAPSQIPKLFSHNVDVDRINSQELAKLPGEATAFQMNSRGPKKLVEQLKRGCLSPEVLELKKNATVMFTKNSKQGRFVNGTLGVVIGFDKENGLPIVKVQSGQKIAAEPMKWNIDEHGSTKAFIEQIPLRLAWAITVHKSQGMSLDAAVMDLSDAFEYGQGYVALSRVRRLSGLHLLGINQKALMVHPQILDKDQEFRAASDLAGEKFKVMAAEIETLHKNFIQACGGRFEPENKTEEKTTFDKIRQTHPNAYRPWDDKQDQELRELFSKKMTIKELAKSFGRKNGAIRSRLIKLGLMATPNSRE